MRFNNFTWELYSSSKRGVKTIKKFSRLTDKFIEPDLRVINWEFSDEYKKRYHVGEISINVRQLICDAVTKVKFKNSDDANRYFEKTLFRKGAPFKMADKKGRRSLIYTFGEEDSDWYDYVGALSLGLYLAHPDYFLPYNFRCKINQLEEIHTEFNIPMPPVPGKNKKDDRGLYYLSINRAWQEFRILHGLSPAEMCAFLYDFAPEFVTPMDSRDLPSPSKVWLATGGAWDFDFLEKSNKDSISRWGGNTGVRRGDIILMYVVSPHKCIHSIWRACSDGFIDPFFHYHGTIWICGRIKTVPVTFAELKKDPLLSQKTAVKASFFGSSGKASCTVEEYEAILKIMKNEGQDLSVLPRIPLRDELPQVKLQDERDVEIQLIEPFLERLGYKKSDWVRQMPIKMGRGERNYPDYAIGAKTKRGDESARMVLESKYQLSSQREFVEAFMQTKSYALRLQSRTMAMAAKEGVWVFPPKDEGFDIKRVIHKTWGELNHPDGLFELKKHIGRSEIFKRR